MVLKRRYLSSQDVGLVLTPELARNAVELALSCHARGDFEQPLKPYMYPLGPDRVEEGGRFITMMGRLGSPLRCAGVKHIAGFPGNLKRGLPRASGMIVLNEVETGIVPAMMDSAAISAARTGAVAALCCQHLGLPQTGKVAVFGAGPIAAASIEAVAALGNPPPAFGIYDSDMFRAEQLAAEMDRRGLPNVHVFDQPRVCAEWAEVVVTATTAKDPYIRREWLRDCRLVVALSFEDVEPAMMLASHLVVDDWGQCARENKPLHRLELAGLLGRDRLYAQLGEIVTGSRPGRQSVKEVFYANLMGMAIEDLAVAWMVFKRAEAQGVGTMLDM